MNELTFQREFVRVAQWAHDRPAFVDHGAGAGVTTFGAHLSTVSRLCGALGRLGVTRSTRFSALLDNRAVYAELWHAGLCGAGLFNSINWRTSRDELLYTLRDAGSAVVFVSAPFAELVDSVRPQLPELRHVVLVGDGEGPHDLTYAQLLDGADERLPDPPREDEPCILMYTGGTTGVPRGVVLDQRALMLNWHRSIEAMHPTPEWTFLQVVPMAHIAALMPLVKVHLAGAGVAVVPQWDAGTALGIIDREAIGAISVVPTMAVQLLGHPDFRPERLRSLRYVGYGTAPMPYGLLQRLLDALPADCRVCQSYGMTETCSTVTMLDADDHRTRDPQLLTSAGRPLSGVALTIRDPFGDELPAGQTGEIWIRCGSVLREYWNRPADTAEVLADGWYHSGDAGYVDERGYLWVVDRMKDMIVTGGENVYSIEVENAISTLPGVARVAVVGIPDAMWGEAVHAVVQVAAGASVTIDEILAHATARLPRHKVPKSVQLTTAALPVSAAGKVLKRRLREQFGA